ncbi:hypothetical protein RCB63_001259 [Listeria monocytogenes]|nr:hypothetical protein [Listeria monocytogenes]
MYKITLITIVLFLICSTVFVIKNAKSKDFDYQMKVSKLEKQNSELQEKINMSEFSSNSSSAENIDSKNVEDTMLKQALSDKMLAENKKVVDALYNYTNYDTRQDKLNMYITETFKEKMLNATKAIDMHEAQIESRLIGYDAYIKFQTSDKITILNLVNSSTSIEKTTTKMKTVVLIDFYNYDNTWKVSNISFIDTK